jgi:hypothetical protein
MDAAATSALLEEAAKKSGIIWVRAAGRGHHPQPVWHVWQDGAFYLLTGGIEQPAPDGLADRAFVTVRSKDKGSRLATYEADVEVVDAGTEEWDAVQGALLGKRLNLPDGDAAPIRWARECVVYRLRPTGEVTETPDQPSTLSHAVEPPPTPARTRVPRPLHLRGRPHRSKGWRTD